MALLFWGKSSSFRQLDVLDRPISENNSAYAPFAQKRRFLKRALFCLILGCLLFTGDLSLSPQLALAQPHRALNYSCVSPHCYGLTEWIGGNGGTMTQIDAQWIQCGSCDGFLNNETWLKSSNSNCNTAQCWIEAGYSTWGNPNHHKAASCNGPGTVANCYFWADNRPNPDGGYNEHPLADESQFGPATFVISREDSITTNWDVAIFTPSGDFSGLSNWYHQQAGQPWPFNPNFIDIGEEVYGTCCVQSPFVGFTNNAWRPLNDSSNWYYQSVGNNPFINPNSSSNPIVPFWESAPNGSNNGGTFAVCSPTCITPPVAATTANKKALPSVAPSPSIRGSFSQPPGVTAITPKTKPSTAAVSQAGVPTITQNDVVQYLSTHDFPSGPTLAGRQETIRQISFISAKDASNRLSGESIGRPDNTLVCFVQVKGPFTLPFMHTAPGAKIVPNQTAMTGVEVFDAQTGNLLLWHVEDFSS